MLPAVAFAARVGLLAASLGGTGGASNAEVALHFDLGRAADSQGRAGFGGTGAVELSLYKTPVVDDATPIALQPYLQRTTVLSIRLGGGAFDGSRDTLAPLDARQRGGLFDGRLRLDAYLTRRFALTGSLRIGYDDIADRSDQSLATPRASSLFSVKNTVGLGLRLGDLRFDAALLLSGERLDGTWAGGLEIQGLVEARAVLLEHIDLRGRVETQPGGAGATVDIDYYPGRRLGLLSGIGGAHGRLVQTSDTALDTLSIRVGASFSATPGFSLLALYTPTWSSHDGVGAVDNRFVVELRSRLPW